MKKRYHILSVLFLALVAPTLLYGCTTNSDSSASTPMRVYAASYPVYFFLNEIAGNDLEVVLLNTVENAHSAQLTPQTISGIASSDGLVYISDHVEGFVDELRDVRSEVPFFEAGEDFFTTEDGTPVALNVESGAVFDPHFWVSPKRVQLLVPKLRDILTEISPESSDLYERNTREVTANLANLDSSYETTLSGCSLDTVISSRVVLSHIGSDYGFTNVGGTNAVHGGEVLVGDLVNTINYINDNDISYILVEEFSDDDIARTIVEQTDVGVLNIDLLEVVKEDDYLVRMQNNLANIKIALGCD